MAGIKGLSVASTYKDLLNITGGTPNEGITSSLKPIYDGAGVETAIQLSTTTLKIPTGKTLDVSGTLSISGTLSSVDAVLTGDLSVGDDLTVTDLISGASMVLTGNMTSDSATIGGGYTGSAGGGTAITSAGNIQTDGFIYTIGNITVGGTSTLTGEVQIGGGYASSGVTIETDGDIFASGNAEVSGTLKVGGGFGDTGVTIYADGEIKSNATATFEDLKVISGSVKTGSTSSPKVKIDDDTKIVFTVEKGGADKEVLSVEKDGTSTFKDEDGDTKFTVKDTGAVKYKSKTTTELNSITGTAGEITYDSVVGAFKIWVP